MPKIERIESHAFAETSLAKVGKMPELEIIGYNAFLNCRSLKEVGNTPNLKIIVGFAFYRCRSLQKICLPEVSSVCATVDGKYVVTGSGDKTARVWRLDDGAHVRTLEGHSDYVSSVCVTTDGEYVVTGSMDYTTRVWRLCDGVHVHTLRLKFGRVGE